jgi:hypothetical protein
MPLEKQGNKFEFFEAVEYVAICTTAIGNSYRPSSLSAKWKLQFWVYLFYVALMSMKYLVPLC